MNEKCVCAGEYEHARVYLSVFAHEAPVCLTYMYMPVAFSSALFAQSRSLLRLSHFLFFLVFNSVGPGHPQSQPGSLAARERPGQVPGPEEGRGAQQPRLGGVLGQHAVLQSQRPRPRECCGAGTKGVTAPRVKGELPD